MINLDIISRSKSLFNMLPWFSSCYNFFLKAQANHEANIVKDETTITLQHLPTQSYFW
jgi:hypothetical protein